jgi:TPR repeat protein
MRRAIVLIAGIVVLAAAWYAMRLSPATRSAPGNDTLPPAAAHVRPSLPAPQSQEDAAALSAAAARRPEGPPRQPQAAVDFAERRAALERRANQGDMAAAAELGELLSQCQYYSPMTPEQIEDTVVTGMAADVEPPRLGGQPVSPELMLLLMQEGYAELGRRCAGTQNAITAADFPAAVEWLRRAAEAGDAGAMVGYAMYSAQDASMAESDDPNLAREAQARRQRAADYLDRAVRAGDMRALQVRADAYANGTLKPRDDIAAYADMHALARTELGRAWPARLVELYLQAMAAPLDAAQLAQAKARGDAVWRECCASGSR